MGRVAKAVEQRILEDAELYIAVEEDAGALILSGIVGSERERQAALDIAEAVAPDWRIEDNIEADAVLPRQIGHLLVAEGEVGAFPGSAAGLSQRGGLEPGDFTDQELVTDPLAASGAGPSSSEEDGEAAGGDAYIPPIDPVATPRAVIGGFETSAMDDIGVERSEISRFPSDEAIAEAIRRALRDDAQTAGLDVRVTVRQRIVHLHGRVFTLDDADSALEVASRVPGIREVRELLDVEAGRIR